ncbi:MAG: hypothetical protein KTR32_29780 [Granulosicoccus sp.]|nr:hypothetical protein [Granulosicoccus sp.]
MDQPTEKKLVKYRNKTFLINLLRSTLIATTAVLLQSCSDTGSVVSDAPEGFNLQDDSILSAQQDNLLSQFAILQDRIIHNSRNNLIDLNTAVDEGTLEVKFQDCITENESGQILEYYCGESGDFGSPDILQTPVFSFSFVNELVCVDTLSDAGSPSLCELSYVETKIGDKYIKYSFLEVDSVPISTIEISDDLVPAFIDTEFLSDHCKLRVIGSAELYSNDRDYCSIVLNQVLGNSQ